MLRATTTFVAEMKNVSWWASRFGLYRKINDHISEIKMCMYSLVVLLNLNILMSSERLRYPGNVLFCSEKKWELCDVDDDIKLSLYMTFFLGIFNLIGYFVIVGFLGLTEIPLMIRQTRRHAAEKTMVYLGLSTGAIEF